MTGVEIFYAFQYPDDDVLLIHVSYLIKFMYVINAFYALTT